MMTKLKTFFLGMLLLVCLLVAWAWTPSIEFDAMQQKYTNEHSKFIISEEGDLLHYRDQGKRSAPVLIFIHGTGDSLHTWEPLITRLEARYSLISLDLPGHGLTGAQSNRDYSMSTFVGAVIGLMDELSIKQAHLVGNSLGGAVAWETSLAASERVKSLVLLAPSGAPKKSGSKSNIGFKLLQSPIGPFLVKRFTPRFVIEQSLLQTVVDPSLVNSQMVDRYWEMLCLKGNRQAMLDLFRTSRNPESWRRLSSIKQATLIVWGSEDNLLNPEMADVFKQNIENSELRILPNVGHLPMLESPEALFDLISEFIII